MLAFLFLPLLVHCTHGKVFHSQETIYHTPDMDLQSLLTWQNVPPPSSCWRNHPYFINHFANILPLGRTKRKWTQKVTVAQVQMLMACMQTQQHTTAAGFKNACLIWMKTTTKRVTLKEKKIWLRIKDWIKTFQPSPKPVKCLLKPALVFRERKVTRITIKTGM